MDHDFGGIANSTDLYIGGEWIAAATSDRIDIISPSSEKSIGSVAEASRGDVDRAVAAARQAFDHGPWPRMTGKERAVQLREIAAKVRERSADFAQSFTAQVGMPLRFAQASSQNYPRYFEYFAGLAETIGFEELRHSQAGVPCMVVREPVGVTVAVVPWNAPMSTTLLKVAPALAAGCTIILKPAPETPLDALILAQCIDEVGLPAGVFSVLPANRDVSDYLIRKPEVDKVSFTGSTAAGLHIASVCGSRMARCVTELGGKSAAIILEDADIEKVVGGVMANLILLTGQQCAAFSRILVPRSRKDEVVQAIAAMMETVKVGDPYDDSTTMGPLIARRQLDRVCGLIAEGSRQGATLVTGGNRPAHLDRGWFIEPTLFADVDNDMAIAREEIFGPVGSVITYDDVEQAIDIANDSNYGLSGGVYTEDTDRAYAIGRRIRTGNFSQNGRVIDFTLPYGGFKQSGLGREGGIEGLYGFTEIKTIFLTSPPSGFANA